MPRNVFNPTSFVRVGGSAGAAVSLVVGGLLVIARWWQGSDLSALPWVMMTAGVSWLGGWRWGLGFAAVATAWEVFGFGPGGSLSGFISRAFSLSAVLAIVAAATASWRAAQEEATRNATTDELTGLLNRRGFRQAVESEISRAGRMGRGFAVALLDCDRFKAINDSLGHPAGDAALRGIAKVLRERTRRYDAVARLGGDEFGVLLPETTAESAMEVIRRLQDSVADVSREPAVRISAGIVWTAGAETTSYDDLLEKADRELLTAKPSGGGGLSLSTLEPESVQRP